MSTYLEWFAQHWGIGMLSECLIAITVVAVSENLSKIWRPK